MNDSLPQPRVAFLGLGLMGGGMARRLLSAGYPLSVYNRSRERATPFETEGAQVAPSPRDGASTAEVVLSMVADDDASRSLWLGAEGALAGVRPGTILVECSTVSVAWIEELAAAALERGCVLLDAPVTGSKPQAAAGELTFLVGGELSAVEKVRPVLATMSRALVHLGPSGSGALLKLVNNFLCGVQAAGLAEAIALIERGGLDRTKALEVLTGGAPGSPLVKTFSGRMTSKDYTPNFHLHLMAKDLSYARKEGTERAVPMEMASAALAVFRSAVAEGYGQKDVSAVIEPLRRRQ